MGHFAALFMIGSLAFGEIVMHYVGIVDDFIYHIIVRGLALAGLASRQYQLIAYLILILALTVFALRVLGGLLGWVLLIFLVLMLLHRVVPGLSTPAGAFQTPLQNVL